MTVLPLHRQPRPLTPEPLKAPLEDPGLPAGDGIELGVGDADQIDQVLVDEAHPSLPDSAQSELGLTRTAQLAHEEHVQGGVPSASATSYPTGTPPRGSASITGMFGAVTLKGDGQAPAGVGTVPEDHGAAEVSAA